MSRPPRPGRCGFTLLESLAAVLTLGLLAAAVVPLLRQLGQGRLAERMQAQVVLRSLAPKLVLTAGMAQTVAEHPGWSLNLSELSAESEPAPPPGLPPPAGPAHQWLLVRIQANDSGEVLAETLVAVLAAGRQP